MKIVAATQNKGKLGELRGITEKYGLELVSMAEAGLADLDIPENGTSFAENSLQKAKTVSELCDLPAIADDSGLCVDYLGGEPGVYSARYAGVHGDDALNRAKILRVMAGVPKEQRKASFHCCITLYFPGGKHISAEGVSVGEIAEKELGEGGFGYDKVFIPEGYDISYAQIGVEQKNKMSHRAKALAQLEEYLKEAGLDEENE